MGETTGEHLIGNEGIMAEGRRIANSERRRDRSPDEGRGTRKKCGSRCSGKGGKHHHGAHKEGEGFGSGAEEGQAGSKEDGISRDGVYYVLELQQTGTQSVHVQNEERWRQKGKCQKRSRGDEEVCSQEQKWCELTTLLMRGIIYAGAGTSI